MAKPTYSETYKPQPAPKGATTKGLKMFALFCVKTMRFLRYTDADSKKVIERAFSMRDIDQYRTEAEASARLAWIKNLKGEKATRNISIIFIEEV